MLLIAIVMPVVMQGITAATMAAGAARHRTDAATLAASKVAELTVTGQWDGGTLSGDFGPDWPGYTWQATVTAWPGDATGIGLQQMDVRVMWTDRGRPESATATSLVYVRPAVSS